jgi:hypothetical protein
MLPAPYFKNNSWIDKNPIFYRRISTIIIFVEMVR